MSVSLIQGRGKQDLLREHEMGTIYIKFIQNFPFKGLLPGHKTALKGLLLKIKKSNFSFRDGTNKTNKNNNRDGAYPIRYWVPTSA